MRLSCLVSSLFAAALHAGVAITSGTATSTFSSGGVAMAAVQIQGTGLTLSGNGLTGSISLGVANSTDQKVTSVTFDPAMSETLSGPVTAFGGTALQLSYNGATYIDQNGNFIIVTMTFSGPRITAPNSAASGSYAASAANVPFTMSGSLTVHSGSATGPVVVTLALSGVGLYSASQQCSGQGLVCSSRATYQFRPSSPANFWLDTSTQGLWSGLYGADGDLIASGDTNFPPYAKVTFSGETRYTWATQTTDPRALQNGAGSPGVASAYTQAPSTGFTIDINFTDGNAHRVALYLLDWDSFYRVETVTIKDTATGNVIDSETLSNFHEGYYAIWNLQGNVTVSVMPAAGSTAVVSGVFFDPVGVTAAPANFTLSTTPVTIAAGLAGNSTVTVSPLNGDAPMVTLATVNWPSGITGTFTANPTNTGAPVAIGVGANVNPGSYSLTVRGTSGATGANGRIALTVTNAAASGFAVTASPVAVVAGFTAASILTANTATGNGDPGISVAAAGAWPAGIVIGATTASSVGVTVLASVTPGQYSLPITVHSAPLNADAAASIALTVTDAPAIDSSAAYTGADSATQGAWNGKYGADGFVIAGGAAMAPAYATVDVTGADTFTWAGVTDDVRAPQSGVGSTSGIASSYYAKTFNINVAMNDGNVHQVSLYLLDWDLIGMAQNVAVMDTATGAILDQRSFSDYRNGKWAVWNLKGTVTLVLSTTIPAFDASFSGIFFDPPPTAGPSSIATAMHSRR